MSLSLQDKFKDTWARMIRPGNAQEKAKIASEMTDLLLSDHGFVEFFAFLKTTNLSIDDAFEMFSRLTLTRSSKYSTYMDYLEANRRNFVEFLQATFDDQQELESGFIWDVYINRIYYKLKSQDLDEHFDFFFNSVVGNVDWTVKVLVKLVKSEFYLEDLNQLYLKNLRFILSSNYSNDQTSYLITHLPVSLHYWLDILRENEQIESILLGQFPMPQPLLEALLLYHIRDEQVPTKLLKDASDLKQLSQDFISSYKTEMHNVVNQGIKDIVQKVSTDPSLKTSQNWIESVISDLKSNDPAILAHGLYNLRKSQLENMVAIKENAQILGELCASCLLHDDTYVFMNAVKMYSEFSNDIIVSFGQVLISKFDRNSDQSKYPRLVEVFSTWIECDRLSPKLMNEFLKLCLLQVKSELEENRISSLNVLASICRSNPQYFIQNHSQIFSVLDLSKFTPKAQDFETKVLFTFIDAFLSTISSASDRFLVKSDTLSGIHSLTQRALNLPDPELNSMAVNNLMKLEHLRRF